MNHIRMDVMNFLNEVSSQHPGAVSFAAGRPADQFFDMPQMMTGVADFQRWYSQRSELSGDVVERHLLQYGRTAGIIADLICAQLKLDESIQCEPDQIMVTSGCQEALLLCLSALCKDAGDAVVVRNPTYIGGTAAARLARIPIYPLAGTPQELAADIESVTCHANANGHRIRALYLIPQYDNPTGDLLTVADRLAILEVCRRHHIVTLEDNPYGLFRFEGAETPLMASLDSAGSVIYLGTYSKTLCPTLRVGFAVVPRTLWGDSHASRDLFMQLSQRKSFTTVNTCQIGQAIVGGVLLRENCSLRNLIKPALAHYHRNRDTLLRSLEAAFWRSSYAISWNHPTGGFFLTLELPFAFDTPEFLKCASNHGVIVMPMSFFALDDSQKYRVRMAFSCISAADIERGVASFAEFVAFQLGDRRPC